MSGPAGGGDLANKIAALVEEKGWNQEDFARISKLNRHTVRQILHGDGARKLRNATVSQCAEALGLSVNELRTLPLPKLLKRMHGKPAADEEAVRTLTDQAALPELISWISRNADRVAEFKVEEVQELLAHQGPGGPMAKLGVEPLVQKIERRREVCCKLKAIAESDYFSMVEQFIGLVYEKVNGPAKR
jgi:transcriptional regulator with XRE-family HTH domain